MTMHDRHDSNRDWAPGHALQRLVFFSDAVFAIAITLLIIEVHAPHLDPAAPDIVYWQALVNLFPNFLGFFVTFFVIGAFWAGHHRAFDCARHWSPKLIMPNLLMLMTIAAMPFFTDFASGSGGARVPAIVYCGWLALTGVFNMRLQRIATSPPVVDHDAPAEHIGMIRRRGEAVVLGALTGLAVGVFAPWFAQPALVSIMVWRRGLDAWHRRRQARAATAA
jgi:uncharacterized membrane protein